MFRTQSSILQIIKDETVMGKVNRSDIIVYALCIATASDLGVKIGEKNIAPPPVKFCRQVNIWNKLYSTKVLFLLDWGGECFIE